MLRRRWWQLAREIPRGRVHLVPQTSIEHSAFPEARFLVRRESILFSQAGRWIILMLVVPVMRYLLIVFVELWTVASVSVRGVLRDPPLSPFSRLTDRQGR